MIQDEASGARTPSDVTKPVQLMMAKAGSELGPLTNCTGKFQGLLSALSVITGIFPILIYTERSVN